MPRSYRARIATEQRYSLAEGIIWDDRAGEALWVDIVAGDLVRNLAAPLARHIDVTVGCVALAEDGGLLLAGHRGLVTISPEGVTSHGPDLLGDRRNVRLNDGAVDPDGRFVVGTLALGERANSEQLLRVSPDGDVEVLRTGITLSNGVAFDSNGTLHHVDTMAKTVSALHGDEWTSVLTDFVGFPDGLAIDAADNFWVAQYGAGLVQQFSAVGELLATVELDTPEATCVGFLPEGLAITTGRESATDANAGAIYLADVDAVGKPEYRWSGSTSRPYWK
jgi:sugar lactone lactonase YvrE